MNVNQLLQKLGYHRKVSGTRKGRVEFSCKTPTYAVNKVRLNNGEEVIVFKKGQERLPFPLDGGFNISQIYENYNLLNSLDNQAKGDRLHNIPTDEIQIAITFLYHTGFKGDFKVNTCTGEIRNLDPTGRENVKERFQEAGFWRN